MSRIVKSVGRVAAVFLVVGLTSCTELLLESDEERSSTATHLSTDFGNAVSHNAAQHIIDPVPSNVLAGAPALDGARATGAYERYRTGTVITPEEVETTKFGTNR